MTILSQDFPCTPFVTLPEVAGLRGRCDSHPGSRGLGRTRRFFSIVDGVLHNPWPYPHSEQLVAVSETRPEDDKSPPVYLNFLDWRRQTQTFASMAIYRNNNYNVSGTAEAQRLSGYMISADFFPTLGGKSRSRPARSSRRTIRWGRRR